MNRGNTGFLLTAISGTLGNTSGTIIGVKAVIGGPFKAPLPTGSPPASSPPDSEPSPPSSEKPEPLARFPNNLLWMWNPGPELHSGAMRCCPGTGQVLDTESPPSPSVMRRLCLLLEEVAAWTAGSLLVTGSSVR